MPFDIIKRWIKDEENLGSPDPNMVVLATATRQGAVHSRVVAIREISNETILFFTQRCSRKVQEILDNPNASMTLWLPLSQNEIVFEGVINQISKSECKAHWDSYPTERKLRFLTYAPNSGKVIESRSSLEGKLSLYREQYRDQDIEMSEDYVGFRLKPNRIYFYSLEVNTLSEVNEYTRGSEGWHKAILSP